MNQLNLSPRPARQPRRPAVAPDAARHPVWFFVFFFLIVAGLSLVAAPGVSWANFGTVPPPPTPVTVLVGPVSSYTPGSQTMTVAGVPVTLADDTKFDERVGPLAQGVWVRIEGHGDGLGGLAALRVKVLPAMPLIRLTGPLDELKPLDSAGVGEFVVDGITVFSTITTIVVGDPQPGDRVNVRAALQTDGTLLATQVIKVGLTPDEDDDEDEDDDVGEGRVYLKGVITFMPDTPGQGVWLVSGIPVQVNESTHIHSRVGVLTEGAWVKVRGQSDAGVIIASEIKTTRSRHFHKLKGTLSSLNRQELEVAVNGITVDLHPGASFRGNPQVGQRVEVKGQLTLANTFEAILVSRRGGHGGGGGGGQPGPGLVVRFTGEVQRLPNDGLYGTWRIAGRDVTVPQGALIDEHKAPVAQGAFVEVTALLGNNNSLTAVLIVVTRAADDEDDDDDDHGEWVEFRGTVNDLPDTANLHGDWLVDDKTVQVGDQTEIRSRDRTIVEGDRVKVKGWRQSDGSVRASKIELLEETDEPTFFTGVITALPDDLQNGTWRIDDRDVVVNESTELNDEHGAFAIGSRVKVYGRRAGNGVVTAQKIWALPAPEISYVGRVASMPSETNGSFAGEWVIGEKTVMASETTEFKQENGPFTVGGLVKVKGRLQSDGSVIATKIATEPLPWIDHVGEILSLPSGDLAAGAGANDNEELLGLWEIGSYTFLVTEETELDDDNGEFAVGVVVKAKGRMRADGVVVAHEIETKRSHDHDDDDDDDD
jgi:hypothetical protein